MKPRSPVPRISLLVVPCLLAGAVSLSAQQRPIVMIDPGHGGEEAGVVENGLLEKDLVLRIGFHTAAELVKRGYDVRFTRTGDTNPSRDDRRRMAEEAGAGLLLMLHINRNDDPARHGAEIYVHEENPASVRAAEAVATALRDMGSAVLVDPRSAAFLQSPTVPTAMIELVFMTNPAERRLITTDAFHRELGEALARASAAFLGGQE